MRYNRFGAGGQNYLQRVKLQRCEFTIVKPVDTNFILNKAPGPSLQMPAAEIHLLKNRK